VSLQDQLLFLLAQHRSFRICRNTFFCPEENTGPRTIRSLGEMALHMQREHGPSKQETEDMVRYMIARFLPSPIKVEVKTTQGTSAKGQWTFRRCDHPGCNYLSTNINSVENHIRKKHNKMHQDLQKLGWFWGTLQTMIRNNARITIAEVLGQGEIWESQELHCHRIFAGPMALRNHFSKTRTVGTLESWEPKMRGLRQT
jgi:hypothetical protein